MPFFGIYNVNVGPETLAESRKPQLPHVQGAAPSSNVDETACAAVRRQVILRLAREEQCMIRSFHVPAGFDGQLGLQGQSFANQGTGLKCPPWPRCGP